MSSKKQSEKIASFVKKLRQILEDNSSEECICWNQTEDSFRITNITKFTDQILPRYFKHNNFASFVRQLNIYGFTRLKNIDVFSYGHPEFLKNNEEAIKQIKRKNLQKERETRQEKIEIMQYCGMKNQESQLKSKCTTLAKVNKELKAQNDRLKSEIEQLANLKEKILIMKQVNQSHVSTFENYKNKTPSKSCFNLISNNRTHEYQKLRVIGKEKQYNDLDIFSFQERLSNKFGEEMNQKIQEF